MGKKSIIDFGAFIKSEKSFRWPAARPTAVACGCEWVLPSEGPPCKRCEGTKVLPVPMSELVDDKTIRYYHG